MALKQLSLWLLSRLLLGGSPSPLNPYRVAGEVRPSGSEKKKESAQGELYKAHHNMNLRPTAHAKQMEEEIFLCMLILAF